MGRLTQMERWTHKATSNAGYIANAGISVWDCIDRLGEYEDTGLTPKQIREINRLYSEKCWEVEEYQKK